MAQNNKLGQSFSFYEHNDLSQLYVDNISSKLQKDAHTNREKRNINDIEINKNDEPQRTVEAKFSVRNPKYIRGSHFSTVQNLKR